MFTCEQDLDVESQSFHLLTLKGAGSILIKLNGGSPYKVVLDDDYEMTYIPINSHFFLGGKGNTLEILLDNTVETLKENPVVKLDLVNFMNMEFNQNHRVVTVLIENIRYKIRRPDLHLNKDGNEDRLQFILQSSLSNQEIMGGEEIAMYINKGDKFPTRSDYDFMATGNMGYGLIKSLSMGNKNYCIEVDCVYSVSIYVKDIDKIFFFPTVFANYSKIDFKKYLFLLEEVEGNKIVTYELDVPIHKGDWAFTIQPMEGFPKMFVNPDDSPEDLNKYKYKSIGQKAEEITITWEESQVYKFSHKKFFVSFQSIGGDDSVATFKFEVKRLKKNEPKFLKLDYAESGVVANQEIVQYKLDFEVDEPEFINFVLEHTAVVGKSILILKECKDKSTNCKITQDDVQTCQKYSLTSQGQRPNPNSNINVGDQNYENNGRMLQSNNNSQYIPQNGQNYNDQRNMNYQPNNNNRPKYQKKTFNWTNGNNNQQNQNYQKIPNKMMNTSTQGIRASNYQNQIPGVVNPNSNEAVSYTHLTLPTTPYV